jgi:hypothetical protein
MVDIKIPKCREDMKRLSDGSIVKINVNGEYVNCIYDRLNMRGITYCMFIYTKNGKIKHCGCILENIVFDNDCAKLASEYTSFVDINQASMRGIYLEQKERLENLGLWRD